MPYRHGTIRLVGFIAAQPVTLLVSAGWRVFPESVGNLAVQHAILLGTSGTIYSGTAPIHCAICILKPRVPDILHTSHILTVRTADQIFRARRRLEQSPAFRLFVLFPPDPL